MALPLWCPWEKISRVCHGGWSSQWWWHPVRQQDGDCKGKLAGQLLALCKCSPIEWCQIWWAQTQLSGWWGEKDLWSRKGLPPLLSLLQSFGMDLSWFLVALLPWRKFVILLSLPAGPWQWVVKFLVLSMLLGWWAPPVGVGWGGGGGEGWEGKEIQVDDRLRWLPWLTYQGGVSA